MKATVTSLEEGVSLLRGNSHFSSEVPIEDVFQQDGLTVAKRAKGHELDAKQDELKCQSRYN